MPEVIPYNKIYSFKIKVVRTTSKSIMIGVIYYKKQKFQRSSYNSGYAVCYLGIDGSKYGSNPLKKKIQVLVKTRQYKRFQIWQGKVFNVWLKVKLEQIQCMSHQVINL